jgi:hypothetical protein
MVAHCRVVTDSLVDKYDDHAKLAKLTSAVSEWFERRGIDITNRAFVDLKQAYLTRFEASISHMIWASYPRSQTSSQIETS